MKVTVFESPQKKQSKKGTEYTINSVFAHLPNSPYPERVSVFNMPNIPHGEYEVPLKVSIYNQRLDVALDFENAKKL